MLARRLASVVIAGTLTMTAAGCGSGNGTAAETAPAVVERSFAMKLPATPFSVDFLSAELDDLSVVERVRSGSGEVVEAPKLRATLKVKNTSTDRTARLVGGAIEYLDTDGRPIDLASGRGETAFSFYSYSGDRVDPGKETSQTIDVPFPSAAMKGSLAELRLRLTYLPTPYRTEAATVSASLVAQGG